MQECNLWDYRKVFLFEASFTNIRNKPGIYSEIETKSREIGFSMPSDLYTGSLLRSLVASKPKSKLFELGTGTGLALSWMVAGMGSESRITTIDNDPELSEIAASFFGHDERVKIICADGAEWIRNYEGNKFDLVFADAWPGKYSDIEYVLDLIHKGGLYSD